MSGEKRTVRAAVLGLASLVLLATSCSDAEPDAADVARTGTALEDVRRAAKETDLPPTGSYTVVTKMGAEPGGEADLDLVTQSTQYDRTRNLVESIQKLNPEATSLLGEQLPPGSPTSFLTLLRGRRGYLQFPQLLSGYWVDLPLGQINKIVGSEVSADLAASVPLLHVLKRPVGAEVVEEGGSSVEYRVLVPARRAAALMSLGSLRRLQDRLGPERVKEAFSGEVIVDLTVVDGLVDSASVDITPIFTSLVEEVSGEAPGEISMIGEWEISEVGESVLIQVPRKGDVLSMKRYREMAGLP